MKPFTQVVKQGTCDMCQREALVEFTIDPYVYELYDRTEWVTLCDDCLQTRRDDI